jgi:hypothetical protein
MNEVKLTLSLREINQILEALGNQSYVSVFELVANIQEQVQTQMKNTGTVETAA